MGAVLGIAAFGRTQEKLGGANNGGLQTSAPATSFSAPSPAPSGFQAPASTGFGATSSSGGFSSGGFGGAPVQTTVTQTFGGGFSSPAPVGTTAGGKKIVPEEAQPLL